MTYKKFYGSTGELKYNSFYIASLLGAKMIPSIIGGNQQQGQGGFGAGGFGGGMGGGSSFGGGMGGGMMGGWVAVVLAAAAASAAVAAA